MKIAVIGCGNWGKNLVRTFYQALGQDLAIVCDQDQKKLDTISKSFPSLNTTTKSEEVFANKDIDGVAIATIAPTHFDLAKKALLSNKHVYVEKPMTLEVHDAEELRRIQRETNKTLMVGHILVFHPAIRRIKQMLDQGDLGDVYYIYSHRLNLGQVRSDENAMWSFAPHDLSVLFYLLDQDIETISAHGQSFLQKDVEDVVFMNLKFTSGAIASIHLSWLDPHKKRTLTIVGSKKMVVFDDMESTEKLKVYDKGVDVAGDYDSFGEYLSLRFGDIVIPRVDSKEPLREACDTFVRAIARNETTESDVNSGCQVVAALNAAQESLKKGGIPIAL